MQLTIVEMAEITGAVGIVLSLLYAGIGLRRNARAVRASVYANATGAFAYGWMELAKSAELTELSLPGGDDFDALDRGGADVPLLWLMCVVLRFPTTSTNSAS